MDYTGLLEVYINPRTVALLSIVAYIVVMLYWHTLKFISTSLQQSKTLKIIKNKTFS